MSRLSFGIVGFALPLYAYELGMSLAQLGMLASFNTVVSLALKPIMGRVADRIGYRRGLLWATVLAQRRHHLVPVGGRAGAVVRRPWGARPLGLGT